jgi:hypothetical protein
MSQTVSCSSCGYVLDPSVADDPNREPCPQCGGKGIGIQVARAVEDDAAGTAGVGYEVTLADEVDVADDLTLSVGPEVYERDAVRGWQEAAAEVQSLEQPLPDHEDETLLDAQRRLRQVFIDLWSLPETAHKKNGVREPVAYGAMHATFETELAHDLGNLAKHGVFNRRTQTGLTPAFGPPRAERPGSGSTLRFRLAIERAGQPCDGVDLARQAVDEWEQHLRSWGLM